jgi:polar amino acid transport system ATP-binding protein/sulfate transport system ATP-binding protein/NitT/TauT family transport system ATP-binding protein
MITKDNLLLSVKDVNLSFGDNKVLRDINFCIKDIHKPGVTQGQVVSLLGKSGIGKTQLFRILAGLMLPDSGTVLAGLDQKPCKVGEMGVVFQDYYIDPWRKVKTLLQKAVTKNPKVAKGDRNDAIKVICEDFNLTEHLDKFPCMLSGGQKQRVAIAEQLLNGGNFLLLDEPFSGLDIIMIDKVIETMIKISLSDELQTLIIVSHDLSNTVSISDTVFVLNKVGDTPGATIVKEIDLIERGLAYQPGIKDMPLFRQTLAEIKDLMK